jgi:Protein of unknown function (DUF1592)/Protein of unknown function (DUF1588)/Protein of unknown function (DUF1595)/Protein of unknown function (DUF1585)/Protein of unknown function (DUF1587)
MAKPRGRDWLAALALLGLTTPGLLGCSGSIGATQSGDGSGGNNTGGSVNGGNGGAVGTGSTGGIDVPVSCGTRTLPVQPLRRLSATQYHNTIRDLFGATLAQPLISGSLFPNTLYSNGFENDAESNTVGTAASNAIEDNGERIGRLILAGADPYLRATMPCSMPTAITDAAIDGCIDNFIRDFGLKAFRRPVSTGETTVIRGLYNTVRGTQTAREAWTTLVQYFVESPGILYRTERGGDAAPIAGLVKPGDYEMASRLSYFFNNTMPDSELFTAAAAGLLSTPEQIKTQAERLMGKPAFWEMLSALHRDWLHLAGLATSAKDPTRFPEFTAAVQLALTQETGRMIRHTLEDGDGSVQTLLTGQNRPLNGPLATFYGQLAPGADANTWVNVDVGNRRGILTGAALMASTSHADKTSPIHRGAFFQSEILCNEVPALPANVDTQGPLQDTANLPTAKQRLAPLLTNGQCQACHSLINPLGFGFENYNAAGKWRDQENNTNLDAAGSLEVDGVESPFASPVELTELIGGAAQTRECYSLQLYRASIGRREFAEDECSIQALKQASGAANGDIRAMLLALTQTDGFLFRRELQQ